MENEQNKPIRTVMRVVVVGLILILLIFLSIGIVRIVPKMLNSLASASLSIGSIFSNGSTTDTTDQTPDDTGTATSSGGFSIRDLTNPTIITPPNYVPASSSPTTSTHTNTNQQPTTNTPVRTNTGASYNTAYTVGQSDIAVEITSKGIIDRTTGQFVPTNTFTIGDMVIVKFKIENRGQFATGAWSARVDMPSSKAADQTRSLGPINSLPAGAAVTGEARFESPTAGTPVVTITVDTNSTTQDINRSNNIAQHALSVSGYNNQYSGTADLQVRVVAIGTVNEYGQFVANNYPRYGQKSAVQFEVTNAGGTASGQWMWRADISGATSNTYSSPYEASIASGASKKFIVGFDSTNVGNTTYSIYIDTANNIAEANESNNSASVSIPVSGY